MPTLKEHYAALRAASAAGDQESVDYIRELVRREQEAADRAEYNPTAGMTTGEKLRAGIGRGMMNVVRNVGNMAQLVSDEDMQDAAALDAPLMETGAGKVGSFIGETAAVMLPTMGAAGLLGRGAGLTAQLARSPIGRGMVEGAVQGAITAGPGNRTGGAVLGAGAGAILPGVASAYRVARSGVRPTAAAQRLMNSGVELTPGQMNPAGALNQIEEAAQAVPYFGRVVGSAREKGYQQFQAKVVQDVAPPGFVVKATQDVHRMVDDVARAYENAYDAAKGFPVSPVVMRTQGGDVPLLTLFRRAAADPAARASADESKAMMRFLQSELSRVRHGNTSSDDLLKIRSHIRTAIREEGGTATAKGRILKSAERAVTESLDSQLPPPAMRALRATDAQYGKFKILEDAVYRAKDQKGSFTPSQFSQAVREASQKGEYARGGGRLRSEAQSAVDIFQARQPLTGRQAVTIGPVLAASVANPVTVGAPLGLATLGLYGTRTGNALAAGRTGLQLGAREIEREIRRRVPKTARELGAAYSRNALVNYVDD